MTVIPFIHYLLFPRGWLAKLLYGALMAALLYALILTMSRGAMLALLVVGFMVFKESRHKVTLLAVALVLAVAGWSVMSPVQKDRYLSLVDRDTTAGATVDGRFKGMVAEFKLGLHRPIVGHGLGTTPEAKVNVMGYRQASHSLYAELLIEIGIIGAVIFLNFLWQVYQRLALNRQRFRSGLFSENAFYHQLNRAMIAVFWMYAFFSINYWGLSQSYWYLFAGLAVSFGRILRLEEEKKAASTPVSADEALQPQKPRFPLAQRRRQKPHWQRGQG